MKQLTQNRFEQVAEIIATLIPAMEADGGGLELCSVEDDGTVRVKFRGACLVCPSINLTIKMGIEFSLKNELDWVSKVERVIEC